MAQSDGGNNYLQEIEFLESLFGGTVSSVVIASVLESFEGNVHLAADTIMNFSDEMCTPQSEEPPNSDESEPSRKSQEEHKELKPTLNVAAPPFEISSHAISNSNATIAMHFSPMSASQGSASIREQSPRPNNQSSPSINEDLPATRQQTDIYQQPVSPANQQPTSTPGPPSTADALSISFSQAFRNTGTIPKKPPDSKPVARYKIKAWPDQVSKILQYHNEGTRTLIIMRGAAGSGKTHLAKHIVDYTVGPSSQNYDRHIFSSDSYYMRGGVYHFNKNTLEQAHATNQRKVWEATKRGVSPIIVDNTNTELWEMEPYIRDGVSNGYVIEYVEPNTAWARNVNQLAQRNIHGVPRESIRRMLDRYDRRVTPEYALRQLRLSYPPNFMPPQLRNIPTFSPPLSPRSSPKRKNPDSDNGSANATNENSRRESPGAQSENVADEPDSRSPNVAKDACAPSENFNDKCDPGSPNAAANDSSPNVEHETIVKKIIEAQKELEEFVKVEQEWEKGESWDTTSETNDNVSPTTASNPKPPRRTEQIDANVNLIETGNICDDWTKISMFMPPWQETQSTSSQQTASIDTKVKEKTSVSTCFEPTDRNEPMHKFLYGKPRNINENVPEKAKSKIPLVVMLHKSTTTHDNDVLSIKEICKNTERHFKELRRMFRSVPREILRDIFESCNFDVNWTVNLVLDSYRNSQIPGSENDVSDSEEEDGPVVECSCLAGYSIIPDVAPIVEPKPAPEPEPVPAASTPASQKKAKRDSKLSDNSLQLKRQIESNVTISENHYSQHYLNMRRRRENNTDRGEEASASTSNVNVENISSIPLPDGDPATSENAMALPEYFTRNNSIPSFATDYRDVAGPYSSNYNLQLLGDYGDSDTESDSNKSDSQEKTVSISLGQDFIQKLDVLFGRPDFQYPDNVSPVVNLPMSLLQQINAHWAMSVASQLDDGSIQTEDMISQDEEFARQLVAKEQEMSDEGKEPEIPTLKEIMDMELAYSIYEKSITDWRNNEPQDLAAKLSREKLYNLFPDIPKEVLSEMLMAHDYSFKATVESLIVSTGQADWLEDEKGVEKFVMHKEMERKEKFVEEQKKNLDEAEWPYLSDPSKPVTLETVNFYRSEAEKFLQCRNRNFEKARQYFNRNSPSAASFYSDIAALHTRRYEQSSSLAAAYLMNYHLKNNPAHDVLDLHYLRVAEAIVNLDLFIDRMILHLRTKNMRYKECWIITGKGAHSVGGPRIKPATRRRLKEREIITKQINGGLVMATLHPTDKMTNEFPEKS